MKASLTSALLLAALSGTMLVSAGQASAATDPLAGSSTADFTVDAKLDPTDPDNGALVLKSVPSFGYGEIKSSAIYSGISSQAATSAGDITISDTRTGNSNWTLTAAMSAFTDGTNPLAGAALNLAATAGTIGGTTNAATITDDGSAATIAAGDGTLHGVNVFTMDKATSTLKLAANPSVTLADGAAYSANVTWTLASDGPTAPTA